MGGGPLVNISVELAHRLICGAHREARLWVCWAAPSMPVADHDVLLSFLPPSVEETVARNIQCRLIRAREVSQAVMSPARALYVDLVARIGTARCANGLTLRQALARSGRASRWWYHPVAAKDCEDDPTFNWLIALLAIRAVANQHGVKRLNLVGAPREVTAVLRGAFVVEEHGRRRASPGWWIGYCGVTSRIRFMLRLLWQIVQIRRAGGLPAGALTVAFSGFWDWSVREDQSGNLIDRYFRQLPATLARHAVSVGWFAWFDPQWESNGSHRRLADLLAPVTCRSDVVMLQALLRPRDVLTVGLDASPIWTFLRVRHRSSFREIFRQGDMNYWPLFFPRLLGGFLDASLPQHELVELATERACHQYQPRVFLSFLEHFPHARAQYAGIHQSRRGTVSVAVQHASYSHAKTMLALHPSCEFLGEPDGHAVPHPDYVCAMGPLGQELFLGCGYAPDRVLLTGSPRYADRRVVASRPLPTELRGDVEGRGLQILVVSTPNLDLEMDMMDAVCAAVQGVKGVRLSLRNHPVRSLDRDPRFARYRDRMQVTTGSLEEDLAQTDLVLFTYSTVAEEAILNGTPVVQWVPCGFHGSALAEVVEIPQARSVEALRKVIQDFRRDPRRFLPSPMVQQRVMERLFSLENSMASQRIIERVIGPLVRGGLSALEKDAPKQRCLNDAGAPGRAVAEAV